MITSPSTMLDGATVFDTVYQMPHEMQYRFSIDGVLYTIEDLKGMPKIERLLFESPEIGIVTTGTLDLTIYPKGSIPKAARIFCECQLTTKDGLFTSWYPIGTYFVSRRQSTGEIMNLQCRDSMVKAGRPYAPLTRIVEWPASCTSVAAEIAGLMGVTVDNRSPLNASLTVDYPSEILMSEVLAMIAAMHGGTWVITAENKLRLIPYPNPSALTPVQDIGKAYGSLNELSTGNSYISRVTLSDDAGNEFSYGNDSGLEMGCKCFYCTDAITRSVFNTLNGALYQPYEIRTAYISPLVEVGDVLLIAKRSGDLRKIVVGQMTLRLSVTARADLKFGVQPDDEEEIPYVSADDLRASRTVSQLGTYFGNRINRSEGFVSEFVQNGAVVAKMTANANEFSMKQLENGQWKNRIYFDAAKGKYIIDGDVTVTSVADLENGLHNTASYIFAADGFHSKLTSDQSFIATDSNASSAKSTAEYVASAEGFNAKLTADSSYKGLNTDLYGDGNPDSPTTKSSIKYKADYVFSAEGFNVLLQANSDYGTQKNTISSTAAGLTSKVEKNSIISTINQSAEEVTIDASKVNINGAEISLTGRTSLNNNVVINTDGFLTAVGMTANGGTFNNITATNISATGRLVGGNWTFDTNGGKYSDSDGRKVVMEILPGGREADGAELADNPSEYRGYFHVSNCDSLYGDDLSYSHNVFIRGKRIILMAGKDNEQKAIMGLFKSGEGSGTQFSFFPYTDSCGNIGSSVRRWDYVRGAHNYSTSSSRKRKKNIRSIEDAGSIIDALQPVTFDYKSDHRHSAGFILEDVYKVDPLFCDVKGDDFEHGGLFYEQFIPYLVKEVQSLRRRMKKMEESA